MVKIGSHLFSFQLDCHPLEDSLGLFLGVMNEREAVEAWVISVFVHAALHCEASLLGYHFSFHGSSSVR